MPFKDYALAAGLGLLLFGGQQGCAPAQPKPGEGLQVRQSASYSPETGIRARSESNYISNVSKDAKDFDASTRPWLDQLQGWPFDFELLKYEEDEGRRAIYTAVRGSPEPAYVLTNLVKNDGDIAAWHIGRAENDGVLKRHGSFRGLRNRRTGAEIPTGVIYMLKKSNNAAVPAIENEEDAETLARIGIGNTLLLRNYTKDLPEDLGRYLSDLSKMKAAGNPRFDEFVNGELRKLTDGVNSNYANFVRDTLNAEGLAWWHSAEQHEAAKGKLRKLDESGEIVHFWDNKLVVTPDSPEGVYHPFVVKRGRDAFAIIGESDVPSLASDPMATIKSKSKMVTQR